MVLPAASAPGRYLGEKASVTLASWWDALVSRSLNPRPVNNGMFMVSKYSGLTHVNLDPPSAPFTCTPRFQLPPFKGTCVEVAEDSTCGTVFTAASKSWMHGTYRSGGKSRRLNST